MAKIIIPGRRHKKDDDEEVKEYINSHPDIYFKLAKKSGYVCPLCQNGEGKDGTGIKEIPGKEGLYKCHKCGFSGDILAFIAKENNLNTGSDFEKVMDIARQIYNTPKGNYHLQKQPQKEKEKGHRMNKTQEPVEIDFTSFFEEASKHINETNYLTERGISDAIQKEFKIGYYKDWKHPESPQMKSGERIIIPTSKTSYVARAIDENVNQQYKAIKAGKSHIFNSKILSEEGNEPIFIVEGEIDALSIIEVGGKAIGLGGTSNTGLLEREVNKKRPLILCLDNDKAGEEASKKIEDFLKKKGIPFMNASETILTDVKDPNEALVKDKEAFKIAVENSKLQLKETLEEEKRNYIQEYRDKITNVFVSFAKEKKSIKTGFKNLDEFLDGGLHPGLYVLGAVSGSGKTTLALQIADNIAENKQDVLFFSGEMWIGEMVAKSLSRISKETSDGNNALTMRTILNIRSHSSYGQRFKNLVTENYNPNLLGYIRIYDGLQEIKDIETKIEKHKKMTGNNPVIFIDYLQIIKSTESSSKERRLQIDEIISQLRIMSVQYETPIFVISSINRFAYGRPKQGTETLEAYGEKEIYMADLKESGGIEYGADVIMTLHAEKDNDNDDKIRQMKLRVIKNRTGRRHKKDECISLKFHTWYNYFEESEKQKTETQDGEDYSNFRGDKPA